MKHLYIVVEGETEVEFVNVLLIPYLVSRGLMTHIQAIPIQIKGGGHGFNNIEHFKNTIRPVLSYEGEPVITTLIDHYGINSEAKLPGCTLCMENNNIEERISCMEGKLNAIVQEIKSYRFFIPNILRHEIETLFFADPSNGFSLETDDIREELLAVWQDISGNIEEINHTPEGAPSKRLKAIYEAENQRYEKIADGIQIAVLTGIEAMLERSPRFRMWVDRLIEVLSERP